MFDVHDTKKKISLLFCLEMFYSVYFQILKFTNLNLMLKRSEKVRLDYCQN